MFSEALCAGMLMAVVMPSCSACGKVYGNADLTLKIEQQLDNWVKYYNEDDIDDDEKIFTEDADWMDNGQKNVVGHDNIVGDYIEIAARLRENFRADGGNDYAVECVEIYTLGDNYGVMINTHNKPGRAMSLWKFKDGVALAHRVMRNTM